MTSPRVAGDTPVHTVVIDWDGTAVPAMWPEQPQEFMPGFERNARRMHAAGIKLVILSARYSPWDPWTGQRRPPHVTAAEIAYIRDTLDRHGLTFIDIWTKDGKPGASVYVDDKGERYNGGARAWDRVTDRILVRLGKEKPQFPAFKQEVTA